MSLVIVGSVNLDIVARVPRIPSPGETLTAHGVTEHEGGKGANQAVAAARAGGARVALVGAVGEDAPGRRLRDALERDGIGLGGLRTLERQRSGTAYISVDDEGENAIVIVPGANRALDRLDPQQREIAGAAEVVLMQLEVETSLVLDAARAAREAGGLVVLNAAPSAPLRDAATAVALLDASDVLVVNEHELADATGETTIEAGLAALRDRVSAVIVTLGARGAIIALGDERAEVPAQQARAVDTTGAGDTFCGVLAARLAEGAEGAEGAGGAVRGGAPERGRRRGHGCAPGAALDFETLRSGVREAVAAAAIAVEREGAQPAIPERREVLERMRGEAPPAGSLRDEATGEHGEATR